MPSKAATDNPLYDLQKTFIRLFRKSFPLLVDKIKFEKSKSHPSNFCFSIKSDSDFFGKLAFDISEEEITVFSDYDHRHFEIYTLDKNISTEKRHQIASISAIEYARDFFNGNIIIEYQMRGNRITKSMQYHKDDPDEYFSATIMFKEDVNIRMLISKVICFFKTKTATKVITKKVNWFGEID